MNATCSITCVCTVLVKTYLERSDVSAVEDINWTTREVMFNFNSLQLILYWTNYMFYKYLDL